jgi:putative FmdB family regulatory protein
VLKIQSSSEVHVPTYSYACTECDNRFDAVQAFTEDAMTTCPECSGRLRKMFNSVGVVFKGSGFYRNDSRETAKSAATSDSGTSSASEKTNSDKSESNKTESNKSESTKSESNKPNSSPAATSSGTSPTRGSTPAATSG